MLKSSYQLGVWSTTTLRRFGGFISRYYREQIDKSEFKEFVLNEELLMSYYKDYKGWEHIEWSMNTDIPSFQVCMFLCHKNNIKYKLARYQMYALCKIYDVQLDD